ncbi:MAG TPA: glucose 1-dehydrogenase [Usitatibacter sp.]|jgi:glucose 1-dehydrogenase|nr:glucose 1-dehydrogenase [Usitatibacter sp.]
MRERLLEGCAAIVTGGSSGIGAGICRAFAREGAKVAINYLSAPAAAEAMAGEIRAAGGEAIAVVADVANESQVAAMFDATEKAFGRIDIVVANAGIQSDAPLETMELSQWNAVIAANLTGQFLCAREAARRFLAQPAGPSPARGKVICMSSVHEVIPWAGHVNYTASKGGVHMMMRSLAQELAPKGIRVNAIAPGAIRTPINRSAWSTPEAAAKLMELIPYGRIGEPEDIARAAVWLASDESDYVTGATLFVDGGMSLYPGFAGNG